MYSLDHHDLGTPRSDSTEQVSIEIDGHPVTVPAGTSIMRAAASIGEQIPKLCATDTLRAFGSCRLCLVEIEGRKGYPASCTTQVAEGMKIRTQSERLTGLRRGVMELYVSDHPAELLSADSPARTEIRDMAQRLGMSTQTRYGWDGERHTGVAKDESNPYFTFDPNACIVCSRCVRACDEVQSTLALTVEGRGFDSRIVASQGESFLESECVSCGACVEACPTTALMEKTLIAAKPPDQAFTTTCAYCGVGCSFKAEVSNGEVVRMVPSREGHANAGHACIKGRFAYGYATHRDRILKPMIRKKITDAWREVSWEEAIGYAAGEFKRIQAQYGKDSVGGITSSRCTNEEAYLVQKLVRAAFGNNNVDTCARVCHSPTGYGLKNTLGAACVRARN
jgi:formate dehydrogenase major subunit